MNSHLIMRWLSITALLVILCHYTSAHNCFVCSSLNGSNPDCELGEASVNRTSMISVDCVTKIGAVTIEGVAKGVMSVGCVTLVGNYKIRGEVLYGLSRYCTAERPPSAPRHIHCAQFDSEGLLNINDRVVTGCSEDCTEPNCNGTPLMKISQQMYRKFTEYRDHLNKTDPTILTVLDFPKIFATAEEQRRMEDAASVKATTPSMGVNLSSVPSVWLGLSSLTAALLMF